MCEWDEIRGNFPEENVGTGGRALWETTVELMVQVELSLALPQAETPRDCGIPVPCDATQLSNCPTEYCTGRTGQGQFWYHVLRRFSPFEA